MPLNKDEVALLTRRTISELRVPVDSPRDLCKMIAVQTVESLAKLVSTDKGVILEEKEPAPPIEMLQHDQDLPEEVLLTRLLKMPAATFVDTRELGHLLKRHPKTILRSAHRGELPPAFRFMGRYGWTVGSIAEWIQAKQAKVQSLENRREAARQRLRP